MIFSAVFTGICRQCLLQSYPRCQVYNVLSMFIILEVGNISAKVSDCFKGVDGKHMEGKDFIL